MILRPPPLPSFLSPPILYTRLLLSIRPHLIIFPLLKIPMTYSSTSDSDTESTLSTDSCDSTSPVSVPVFRPTHSQKLIVYRLSKSKENTPVQRRPVIRILSPPSPSRTIFTIGAPFPPLYRVTIVSPPPAITSVSASYSSRLFQPPPRDVISTSIPDTDCKADVDHSLSSSSLSSPLLLSASPVLAGAEKEDKEIELTKESTDQMFAGMLACACVAPPSNNYAERLLLMAKITDLVNDMEADIAIIRDTGWVIGDGNALFVTCCSISYDSPSVLICTSIPPEFRGHLGAPNSYQKFLHDVDRRRIAIETESIPYMPSDRVSKLPQVSSAWSSPLCIPRTTSYLVLASAQAIAHALPC